MGRLSVWPVIVVGMLAEGVMAAPPPAPRSAGGTVQTIVPPVKPPAVPSAQKPAATRGTLSTANPLGPARPQSRTVRPTTSAPAGRPSAGAARSQGQVQVFFTEGLAIPSAGMAPISPGKLSVPALPVAPAATATQIEKPRPRSAVRRPVPSATGIRPVPAPAPIAAEGETRPAALIGQVRDEQGKPIGNATVAVGEHKTTTDASGSFVLGGLSAGRWAVKITHQAFTPLESRVWLVDGLKTPVTLSLVRPIIRQPATRVGLLGVGSLPTTDTLAQNLAEALVRNGAFPEIKPLAFIPRDEVLPVLRKFERPLYEVLDHDRPEPELREMVRDFFDFMGLSALAVARVDMLTRQEGNANRLSSHSKVELWQFNKEGRLEIKTLIEAGRSEDQDAALSKAEADQLYQFQIAKQAEEMTRKWEQNNPFSEFTGVPIEPGNGQRTDTRVELLPTGKPPVPEPAKPPD